MTFHSSDYLKRFGLSKTAIREDVLTLLFESEVALSPRELEDKLQGPVDRVTLYRTLKLFDEKKLIHKIILEDQTTKYVFVNPEMGTAHPHFHCLMCDKVVCLPNSPLPSCQLPAGFSVQSQSTIIEGTCQRCNK